MSGATPGGAGRQLHGLGSNRGLRDARSWKAPRPDVPVDLFNRQQWSGTSYSQWVNIWLAFDRPRQAYVDDVDDDADDDADDDVDDDVDVEESEASPDTSWT